MEKPPPQKKRQKHISFTTRTFTAKANVYWQDLSVMLNLLLALVGLNFPRSIVDCIMWTWIVILCVLKRTQLKNAWKLHISWLWKITCQSKFAIWMKILHPGNRPERNFFGWGKVLLGLKAFMSWRKCCRLKLKAFLIWHSDYPGSSSTLGAGKSHG